MAFDAQKQIRENALELQDFLKDLKQWETIVKEKDKNLKNESQDNVSNVPPVRGHKHTQSTKGGTELSQKGHGETKAKRSVEDHLSSATAAKHTYDRFRDKWDKFDVDAALKEVDEDGSAASTNVQKEKKKKKVQIGSEPVDHHGPSALMSAPQSSQKPAAKPGNSNGFSSILKSESSSDPFVDATSEKEMGNKFFKEKKFVQAIECYSRSIALQPSAVSYANRAMAYIKIRRFKEAEADCTEALALDDRYIKAYSRRGTARNEQGNHLGAVADAEFALRLEPENKELKEQYINFKALCEKAIGLKEEKKVAIPIKELDTGTTSVISRVDMRKDDALLLKEGSPTEPSPTAAVRQAGAKQPIESGKVSVASVQTVAASVAAARAATYTVVAVPKTFYDFEAAWKSLSHKPSQQAELLKVIKPSSFPQLFKDNLSAKFLGEIIHSLEHFFPDNASHAIEILESLTMAKRFSLSVMCFNKKEKEELWELWEGAFIGSQIDNEKVKILSGLRQKFQL